MSIDPLLDQRREFLSIAGAGALAFATAGATTRIATRSSSSPDPWLGPLSGKHKMYFDATSAAGGWALVYAMNWLSTASAAYGEKESDFSAVIGARHFGAVLMLNDSIWAKYPLGAMMNVMDPQTKAPSKRNIFFKSQQGDLMFADSAIDKLQARGVFMVACSVALGAISGMAGGQVGVAAEQAKAEFMAGLLPGVKPVPSGVFALSHAQEKGCAYCYAG
jgi:intracellular sulfur oxidation DsrE/DsrF family protein